MDVPTCSQYFEHTGSFHAWSVHAVREYQLFPSESSAFLHIPFVKQKSPMGQHVEWPPASTAVMLQGTCILPSNGDGLPFKL
jgi:hypothetical protein